ncbi:MAG: AAA family ATPase [Acidobacteria bacterium]|nr:AAA family ATPase [Acidobacteriota bacterium]
MGQRIETTDNLDILLTVLPLPIRAGIESQGKPESLVEIILDLGRQPEARYMDHSAYLDGGNISREDIQYVISRIGAFTKDNRAGIERTLHRISAIRNRFGDIIGLTCRVGRAVFGTVDIVRDVIESGKSVLLLGPPGVGKTTLLREAARVMADELGKRVVVVDTSNEIAGDGDIPHPGIGRARRMQVPSPERQHAVMIEAVENHMPEVIVIDEIGTEAEALAARTIAERGVQLIATAHGHTLDNLLINPTLADLIGGIQAVTLSDEEAKRRGTQKTVLERKAPPTFDILIEIQTKDRFAIHHNVATVVDQYLRGIAQRPEIRVRTEDYGVEIVSPPAPAVTAPPPARRSQAGAESPKKKVLRIYPYGVTRQRLERGIRELRVPAYATNKLDQADLILTLKGHAKGHSKTLREAMDRNIPVHVIKSNTLKQIQALLREMFSESEYMDESEAALREVEDAIAQVVSEQQPVELQPTNPYMRRLQHQLVEQYGLLSESKGREPFRRIVIYPVERG